MEFLSLIHDLTKEFEQNVVVRDNGTLLLGPDTVPRCQHMLFPPLKKEYLERNLTLQYNGHFPKEYLYLLQYLNGANLCGARLKMMEFTVAHYFLIIFGLPIIPPYARHPDREEPYDLRVENLGHHPELPSSWLKCGTYKRDYDFSVQYEIFIDSKTDQVYACAKGQKEIVDSWPNLDVCLCSIYESFSDRKYEYEYTPQTNY